MVIVSLVEVGIESDLIVVLFKRSHEVSASVEVIHLGSGGTLMRAFSEAKQLQVRGYLLDAFLLVEFGHEILFRLCEQSAVRGVLHEIPIVSRLYPISFIVGPNVKR